MNMTDCSLLSKRLRSGLLLLLGCAAPSLMFAVAPNATDDDLRTPNSNRVAANASKIIAESTLTGNDTGDDKAIKSVTSPTSDGATVAWDDTLNQVTYTPGDGNSDKFLELDAGETEDDSFVYTLEGSDGDDDTATVRVRVVGVNDDPTIGGTTGTASVNDNDSTNEPLSAVTIDDVDVENVTVTITVDNSKGEFSNYAAEDFARSENSGNYIYTYTGSTSNAQSRVRDLNFVPVANLAEVDSSTSLSISIQVADEGSGVSANKAVSIVSINDRPNITVPSADVEIDDDTTSKIFAAVTIVDPDPGDAQDVVITYNDAKGSFPTSAQYTLAGSGSSATLTISDATVSSANTIIQGLDFTPVPNQVAVGQTEDLSFSIKTTDEKNTTRTRSVTVEVTSVNEPPVVIENGGATNLETSAGGSVIPFSLVTITDPDVEASGSGEGAGDDFTATIVVSRDSGTDLGAIVSSSFIGSNGTYTYTAAIEVLQDAVRALAFVAPSNEADLDLTLTVTDAQDTTSDPLVVNVVATVPEPGISGLEDGQEVADNSALLPFSSAIFNSFGATDRVIEVSLGNDTKGTFDILGDFVYIPAVEDDPDTESVDESYPAVYRMTGNAVDATQALQNIRFNPTENLIVGASDTVELFVRVYVSIGGTRLSNDNISVTVTPVNDAPNISSDSPTYRIDDDESELPYRSLLVSDPDEGGDQEVRITLSLEGNNSIPGVAGVISLDIDNEDFDLEDFEGDMFLDASLYTFDNKSNTDPTDDQIQIGNFIFDYNASTLKISFDSFETALEADDDYFGVDFSSLELSFNKDFDPDSDSNTVNNVALLSFFPSTGSSDAKRAFVEELVGQDGFFVTQFIGEPDTLNDLLGIVKFTPTRNRNQDGERETVVFTLLVADGNGGAAQTSDVNVVVLAVDGAPEITGIPDLSQQPFPVPATVTTDTTSTPFVGIQVTDDVEADGPETVTVEIALDDFEKGDLSLATADKTALTDAGGSFGEIGDDTGVYELTGTLNAVNTALVKLIYTLSSGFAFELSEPGATEFTITATDSSLAANQTTATYAIVVREPIVARVVTSTEDNSTGSAINGTLRKAIEDANNNDFIVFDFATDAFPATIRLQQPLIIEKNLTIIGPRPENLTITGDSDGDDTPDVQLFQVKNGASLHLEQLTLKHGTAASYGGAVSVQYQNEKAASLSVRFVSFVENDAGQYGGAIDVDRGNIRIDQCLFYRNRVTGSTAVSGGAVSIFNFGESYITNSTFVENEQENSGGDGGAGVYVQTSDGEQDCKVYVEHCTFKDNVDAALKGSAILCSFPRTVVTLRNNIFADELGEDGVVLYELSGGSFTTLGGNIATDETNTIYTQGGDKRQDVTILDNEADYRSTDPGLLDLADNEGPTLTCGLATDSIAKGKADAPPTPVSEIVVTDQRGVWRDANRDSGAFQSGSFKRININEIYLESGSQFLEFYNPSESDPLDLQGVKVFVDGGLTPIYEFTASKPVNPGAGFVLLESDWQDDFELNAETGTIVLKTASDQLLLEIEYVANFDFVGVTVPAEIEADGQSITRYPFFEGAFLPHRRVVQRVTGIVQDTGGLFSSGEDVTGTPLNGGNAPPIAIKDLEGYALFANETLNIDVLANDLDFDRTDTLEIDAIERITNGIINNDELDGYDDFTGSTVTNGDYDLASFPPDPAEYPDYTSESTLVADNVLVQVDTTGSRDTILYNPNPVASDYMRGLSEGETVIDVWAYVVQDYSEGGAENKRDPREDDGDDTTNADDEKRAENFKRATSYFYVAVTGINEAPEANDDGSFTTPENQPIRFLADQALLLSDVDDEFDFEDQLDDYKDFDSGGVEGTYLPIRQTTALLANDEDDDNDDTNTTIELINVHQDATVVDQVTTTSALGATVTLDIRANRTETNIVYDPRGSATLNALSATDTPVEDSFYYTVRDRHGAIGTAKVTILVSGVNDIPTANDDADFFASQGSTTDILESELLANDTDPDQDGEDVVDAPEISVVPPTTVLGAALTFDGTTITYDPTSLPFYDYLARNEVVIDSFEYTITDSNDGISTATVFIEFVGINDTPVADDDVLAINENESLEVDAASGLIANDFDIDMNAPLVVEFLEAVKLDLIAAETVSPLPVDTVIEDLSDILTKQELADLLEALGGSVLTSEQINALSIEELEDLVDAAAEALALEQPEFKGSQVTNTDPEDDIWVIAQRDVTTDLGATLNIETDGSFSYDANSDLIESMFEGEEIIEVFQYTLTDNSRTSASDDNFKITSNSVDVVLPVLVNDFVAGSERTLIAGVSDDGGSVVVESEDHALRNGLLVQIEYTQNDEVFSGVFPITVVGADEFSIPLEFSEYPAGVDVTWRPWFNITVAGTPDNDGKLEIGEDAQTLVYSPKATFFGVETFTYTIEDGAGGQDVATVEMLVIQQPFNSFLVAKDDLFDVYEGQPAVDIDVLANDNVLPEEGSDLFIVEVVAIDSASGTIGINGGKSLSYEPDATGLQTFEYTVSGGGTSQVTARVTFNVIEAEVFVVDSDTVEASVTETFRDIGENFIVVEDSSGNLFDVLANDQTLDDYPVTLDLIEIVSTASDGVAQLDGDLVNYTPDASFVGNDSFTYRVRDELGNEQVKTVNVQVVADEDEFYAVEDHYIVWAGATSVDLPVLDNDLATGANSTSLIVTNLGLDTQAPPQANRVAFTGSKVIYSAPDDAGTEVFTYEISDGTTERREAVILVTVVESFPALAPNDDLFAVAKNSSGHTFDVLLNDTAYPLVGWDRTISAVSATDEGGVVETDGATLSYSPAADFYGLETFTYTTVDAFGQEPVISTVTVMVGMQLTGHDDYVVLENSDDNVFRVLVNDDLLNRYAEEYSIVEMHAAATTQGGSVSTNAAGPNNYLIYTPAEDFDGEDTFTYEVIDQSGVVVEETVAVQVIDEDSDRDTAFLSVTVTGVNDLPVVLGVADGDTDDKTSVKPFPAVTITDVDEAGNQLQTVTITFDSTMGALTNAPGFSEDPAGVFSITATPATVTAALQAVVFTPEENLMPPVFYDVDFNLTVDDGYVDPLISNTATITILAINDEPEPQPDSYSTFENQAIRILADDTLINAAISETFDFGDLDPDFQAVNATGQTVILKPVPQTASLLANDDDVDIDDDAEVTQPVDSVSTIEVINVHTTATRVDQISGLTALGAQVTLDIRAQREETNILYDPRGSATLNALASGETIDDCFYYTVRDKHGALGVAKVTITVTGVNDVPTANADDGFETGEDTALNIFDDDVLANDTDPDQDVSNPNDDPIIVDDFPKTSDLGANLTFDGTNITYDPTGVEVFESLARNEFIEDFITYTITDEMGGTSTSTISLEIEGFNDAPIAEDDLLEIDENDTQSRIRGTGLISNDTEIDINGTTPDDDHWIIPQREVTTPLGAALDIETDGSYTYDANSMFIDSMIEGELQVEVFPYIVIDNFRTSSAPDSYKVITDSTDVVLPVLSNDDVAGSATVEILGYAEDAGDAGRVIIESTNHELRDGLLIKIQSYAGGGAYNGVFPVTVEGRNHFSIETPFVDDPAGTRGTWRPWFKITALGETDQEGEVTINTDAQTILYTPNAGFSGTETFEYTIEDGVGGQDVTVVTLTVLQAPLNTVISASDDRFQVGQGESAVEVDVLANDNSLPAVGTALTVTEVAPASATGSLDIVNGGKALSYTPATDVFTGTETFTYTVTGGGSSTAQATITIEVLDRTDFLDGNDDDFVVTENSVNNMLDVAANDASLPTFPVSFEVDSVTAPSAGGSATVVAGKVSYSPLAGFTGTETFDYTIRDGSGGNATQTVSVEVVADVDDFYAKHDRYIVLAGSGELELPVLRNDGTSGATPVDALLIINLGLDTEAPPEVSRVSFTDDVVRYEPPAVTGIEIFNYEITDGTDQRREAIITIEIVDELPTQPNALDDDFHVEKNAEPVELDVLLNDSPLPDAGWVWTINSVGATDQGGTAVNNGGTSITYTPANGFYGVEAFTYTITDSFGKVASASVTVTVGEQLTEPDVYVVLENSTDNDFPVLVNDDILERFPADYTIDEVGTPDAGGAVSIDGDGPNNQLLYAPLADYVGFETFTYTVIDNTGATLTETVTVEVIAEESDRDFADFRVEITGVNDIPVVANVSDGATTDKQSVKPFPTISITDKDGVTTTVDFADFGVQEQTVILEYDTFYGTIATPTVDTPALTSLGNGRYRVIGTPAEVSAVLQDVVFTPYENLIDYIDPGQDDVDFNLSIDDGYVVTPVTTTATITITPIDDAPTIASPIPDQFFQVNSPNRGYLLTPHFADVDDDVPGGQITWTVSGNTNPSLFDSVTIDQAKQLVVFDFAADQFGTSEITIRGTDRGLLFVEDTFTVTVDGPPVIDLPEGEENPAAAREAGNRDFFRQDFRQEFRVTNEGALRADAFIVHLDNFFDGQPLDVQILDAEYSTDENGTPENFLDDTTTSNNVTVNVIEADHPVKFAVKFDVPLESGESTVVHFRYRANELDNDPVRPDVRIELVGATPVGSGLILEQLNLANGEVCLTIDLSVGDALELQYSEDLINWTPWATPLPTIGADSFDQEYKLVDDGLNTSPHPSQVSNRFYRVVEITPPE